MDLTSILHALSSWAASLFDAESYGAVQSIIALTAADAVFTALLALSGKWTERFSLTWFVTEYLEKTIAYAGGLLVLAFLGRTSPEIHVIFLGMAASYLAYELKGVPAKLARLLPSASAPSTSPIAAAAPKPPPIV